MEISTLVTVLDQPHLAADHLNGWGLTDVQRGQQLLLELAETGLTLDLLSGVCKQLARHLPDTPDPDAAFSAFRRYLFAVRSPLGLAALFERDASAMPLLLSALSLGPRWAELLIDDPEAFDLLRQTAGQRDSAADLTAELLAEIETLGDERSIIGTLTRFRNRHLLRIAQGEVVGNADLALVETQLTQLAETLIAGALAAAHKKARGAKFLPGRADERALHLCVIAVGQLGAGQCSYALPLELLFVYDVAANDAATLRTLHEHVERIAKIMCRLLNEAGSDESGNRVRTVSLPDSPIATIAHIAGDVVLGFDSFGRTWHRQEMLKARAVAGDLALGNSVLARLETWLFRRYLGRADESGIKALKRRIRTGALVHQDDWSDVRLARGGLKTIEATVEFLQLLTGGDHLAVRRQGTLAVLAGLEQADTLTAAEHTELAASHSYFRAVENRLQILTGSATAELPDQPNLVERIAAQLGQRIDAAAFSEDLRDRLGRTWKVLDRLLASAFPEEPPTTREVDLLLAPSPPDEEIRAALSPFGFQRPEQALATLNDLASEQVPFLSTRRCRHLLATILPQLLCAVGATPHPDRTLDNLARVSNSVGGKGILWELFRFNPPSLELYVKLCAASPYLSDILTTNPGMIDELVDSLQIDKLPTRSVLETTLAELCRGASDTLPILHDFKNAEHMRIGVRDILGKEDIDRTHEALADVAETCLAHVAELEYAKLVEKFGVPTIGSGPMEGETSRLVIVGLGKLGGREPNYHSHVDVLFLYEGEGTTRRAGRSRHQERTANSHFYTQFAQRIVKQLSELTAKGRLYAIDTLLLPIGAGGGLALTFSDLTQHFTSGAAPLWQWQVLCQARPVFGEAASTQRAAQLIQTLLKERAPLESDMEEIRRTRLQLERGASAHNIKRGLGGTLDIEHLVHLLQLRHAGERSEVLTTNTQLAIPSLVAAGALPAKIGQQLGDSYRFLRRVESGLRLLDTSARHDLPADATEMHRLALLLGHSNPERLRETCLQLMSDNRAVFDRLTAPV